MFSLRALRFLLCSFYLSYYARIGSWEFYLNYPQINEVGKFDHKENTHSVKGDIRVAFRLCFKASPSAKPFIWK